MKNELAIMTDDVLSRVKTDVEFEVNTKAEWRFCCGVFTDYVLRHTEYSEKTKRGMRDNIAHMKSDKVLLQKMISLFKKEYANMMNLNEYVDRLVAAIVNFPIEENIVDDKHIDEERAFIRGLLIYPNEWYKDDEDIEEDTEEISFQKVFLMSNMNMRQFSEYFEIPYRTVQDWKRGVSKCPEYLLNLIQYKLEKEEIID